MNLLPSREDVILRRARSSPRDHTPRNGSTAVGWGQHIACRAGVPCDHVTAFHLRTGPSSGYRRAQDDTSERVSTMKLRHYRKTRIRTMQQHSIQAKAVPGSRFFEPVSLHSKSAVFQIGSIPKRHSPLRSPACVGTAAPGCPTEQSSVALWAAARDTLKAMTGFVSAATVFASLLRNRSFPRMRLKFAPPLKIKRFVDGSPKPR